MQVPVYLIGNDCCIILHSVARDVWFTIGISVGG